MHSIFNKFLFPQRHKGKHLYKNNPKKRPWNGSLAFNLPIALCLSVILISCSDNAISSPDDPETPAEQIDESRIYLSLAVDPTGGNGGGTRTQTNYFDEMEQEDGQEWENVIDYVKILMVNPTNGLVVLPLTVTGGDLTPNNKIYTAVSELQYSDLKSLLDIAGGDGKVTVDLYVVCNNRELSWTKGDDKIQRELTIGNMEGIDQYGGRNKPGPENSTLVNRFLMSNADYANAEEDRTKSLYSVIIDTNELKRHTDKNNPYVVTKDGEQTSNHFVVPVQRALARFDLGGSTDEKAFTYYFDEEGYPLGREVNGKVPEGAFMSVWVRYITLANVNRTFNLFKETGYPDEEGKKDKWGFFWSEFDGENKRFVFDPKYIDDSDTGKKQWLIKANAKETGAKGKLAEFYEHHITDYTWHDDNNVYDKIDELLKNGTLAGPVGNDVNTADKDNYRIWQYCTPNTIHETSMQKNGITTAVAFAARMNFIKGGLGEGTTRPDENADEDYKKKYRETPIYAFKGRFYGTNHTMQYWAAHPRNAKDQEMREAYIAAWKEAGLGNDPFVADKRSAAEVESWTNFLELTNWDGDENKANRFNIYNIKPSKDLSIELTKRGFSIYIPVNFDPEHKGENWEYACIYYYWNRHNDNRNNEVMGPMEFNVVRNNIYKLMLTDVFTVGHPIPDTSEDNPIETDADPLDPWTDDEVVKRYISVDCQVMPWGVRIDDNITLY